MGIAKNIEISLLLDIYGEILTRKQRDIMDLYWNKDLSLSEIAENTETSRQAVMDCIKRATARLYKMEHTLGMLQKYTVTRKAVETILPLAEGAADKEAILSQLQKLQDVWEDI